MGSSTRFSTQQVIVLKISDLSTHSAEIPHTFPHGIEYEKALISFYYHNNDRLERYE